MPSTTVRITPRARETLKRLAKEMGEPMRKVLERAIEAYRREAFIKACNDSYATLQKDPKAWADYVKEREAWDATLSDGLAEDD